MTVTNELYIGGKRYIEGYCENSEVSTLPTDVAMGSHFFAVDTSKTVYFQNANAGWVDPTE